MARRAIYMVNIGGVDVTSRIDPLLQSLSVSDKAGTHSDSATITLNDTDGHVSLPGDGVPVMIALGWEDGGVRPVFMGTVDEVRSSGSRSGRTITVTAKGVDTKSKAKQPQQKHFDKKKIGDILNEAGKMPGISVTVDPELASIEREYVVMADESFINLGERIAREVGGNFRITGKTAVLAKRDGAYAGMVMAAWGSNLHSWDITPKLGRPQVKKSRVRWYDRKEAKWKEQDVEVQSDAEAEHVTRFPEPNEDQAKKRAGSDKATSERDTAQGSVTIEGDTGAIPDGMCIVSGARAGIDGAYRIETVTHEYSRSGFTTKLDLKALGSGGSSSSDGSASSGSSGTPGATPSTPGATPGAVPGPVPGATPTLPPESSTPPGGYNAPGYSSGW